MFKEIGQLAGVLKNLPRMREQLDKMKQRLTQIQAEGDAGGGMVKVKANGSMEIMSCQISDELLKMNDKEMLEDLIMGAANVALKKVRQQVAEETSRLAGDMGLPAGLNFPGMGEENDDTEDLSEDEEE